MTYFPVNTIETAPEGSRAALRQLQANFGMIPNILGSMSTSPVLVNSLVGLFGTVHSGSFTEAQIQTLLLTNAVTNACSWAVAFHTALGLQAGLDPADVQAIRERRLPQDEKNAALSALAQNLIEKRGHLKIVISHPSSPSALARRWSWKLLPSSPPPPSRTIPAASRKLRWSRRFRLMSGIRRRLDLDITS